MDLKPLEIFCKHLSNENIDIRTFRDAERDGITVSLVSRVHVSRYDTIKHGHRVIGENMSLLRENIMSSDLFSGERKALAEYEKLKNMQFVLDALKELDLSSIKEQKKDDYINVLKMLGGK